MHSRPTSRAHYRARRTRRRDRGRRGRGGHPPCPQRGATFRGRPRCGCIAAGRESQQGRHRPAARRTAVRLGRPGLASTSTPCCFSYLVEGRGEQARVPLGQALAQRPGQVQRAELDGIEDPSFELGLCRRGFRPVNGLHWSRVVANGLEPGRFDLALAVTIQLVYKAFVSVLPSRSSPVHPAILDAPSRAHEHRPGLGAGCTAPAKAPAPCTRRRGPSTPLPAGHRVS